MWLKWRGESEMKNGGLAGPIWEESILFGRECAANLGGARTKSGANGTSRPAPRPQGRERQQWREELPRDQTCPHNLTHARAARVFPFLKRREQKWTNVIYQMTRPPTRAPSNPASVSASTTRCRRLLALVIFWNAIMSLVNWASGTIPRTLPNGFGVECDLSPKKYTRRRLESLGYLLQATGRNVPSPSLVVLD